jgi:hypothetical protein
MLLLCLGEKTIAREEFMEKRNKRKWGKMDLMDTKVKVK